MTNADKIRAMTDEDLAKLLVNGPGWGSWFPSVEHQLEWLQKEVSE